MKSKSSKVEYPKNLQTPKSGTASEYEYRKVTKRILSKKRLGILGLV